MTTYITKSACYNEGRNKKSLPRWWNEKNVNASLHDYLWEFSMFNMDGFHGHALYECQK